MTKKCNHIRQQDEYFCTTCGRRWDVDEEPPECHTDTSYSAYFKCEDDCSDVFFKDELSTVPETSP